MATSEPSASRDLSDSASLIRSPIGRLRLTGWTEGGSFLVLLGIAMPLKYAANMPEAVRFVGWIHGVLFVLLFLALIDALSRTSMRLSLAAVVFIAALIPFGPFVIDRRLRREFGSGA